MDAIGNDSLIASAEAVLNPHTVDDRRFGDVGSTLVTRAGNRYSGVCIDTSSGTGFCAEHAAIAAMVTAGEYEIAKIVEMPDIQSFIRAQGAEPALMDPATFGAYITSERAKWAKVIKSRNIRID